ncbi:hypothetical protein PV327_004082 [Microctonus hyperodae]|uniref:DUF4806 domain-containing protein n=1 Tax=Microctonus hyperodae TaxID=165561 RepID=A0AA39FBN5_MICHY|nr:hypothetical protein PV327_004082 [Microctonus hyperodae]
MSTRTCLKNDGLLKISDTSIESNNTTSTINQQKNIHDLSSSDEQDGNSFINEIYTESNIEKAETMNSVSEIAHVTTKITTTNTEIEKNHICCEETSELVLKEFRKLSQQLGTLHGLVTEMRNGLQQIKNNKFCARSVPKEKVHNIQVPFTTLNEFEIFSDALKDNLSLKTELEDMIWSLIDGTNKLSKSLTNILMKFFKAEVLNQFTAIKKLVKKKFSNKLISVFAYMKLYWKNTKIKTHLKQNYIIKLLAECSTTLKIGRMVEKLSNRRIKFFKY